MRKQLRKASSKKSPYFWGLIKPENGLVSPLFLWARPVQDIYKTHFCLMLYTQPELPANHTEKVLEEASWHETDVISCAAPNLSNIPGNAMNPDSGSKAVAIQPADLLELHKKCMSRVLDIAAAKGRRGHGSGCVWRCFSGFCELESVFF